MLPLRALITQTHTANPEPNPYRLAELVFAQIPVEEHAALALKYVAVKCQDWNSEDRRGKIGVVEAEPALAMVGAPRVSSARGRVASQVRSDMTRWLEAGFQIGGRYLQRQHLTFADLVEAAEERRQKAGTMVHWAEIYERQAKALAATGATCIGELTTQQQRALADMER